jgi:hypothetical protein
MMLYTRNYGMPVLVPLSIFLVKGSEFITFHKVIWNRYFELLHLIILVSRKQHISGFLWIHKLNFGILEAG